MRVNEKFPNWITSGGVTPQDFTGFISNIVYPYFYAQDKPTFRYPYSSNVFPSITVGQNAYWLSDLDMLFATRFGERELRSFIKNIDFHNDATKSLTTDQINNSVRLAQAINLRYGDKWNHIAETLAIEYNPLENYNRNENVQYQDNHVGNEIDNRISGSSMDDDGNVTTSETTKKKSTKGIVGGWDDTNNNTKSFENSKQTETWDKVSGFNGGDSDNGKPSEYSKTLETFTDSSGGTPKNYSESDNGGTSRRYSKKATGLHPDDDYLETVEDMGYESNKHHINTADYGYHNNTTSGNIGVTTSQQMLQSELDVRKNLLYDIIINDIAEFLTISIY